MQELRRGHVDDTVDSPHKGRPALIVEDEDHTGSRQLLRVLPVATPGNNAVTCCVPTRWQRYVRMHVLSPYYTNAPVTKDHMEIQIKLAVEVHQEAAKFEFLSSHL